jgi:glyceraldehyde 3-phosphate dehydrogenase
MQRVAISGLSRIGRNLFRVLHAHPQFEIAAFADAADPEALAYLLEFDTLLGRFPGKIELDGGVLRVDGTTVPLVASDDPASIPWRNFGVDALLEATPRAQTRAQLEACVANGAGRVVLCSPPAEPPDATIVLGCNDSAIRREHRIISNGSATAHAAGPVLKVLLREFGVRRAFLTTIHAYTDQQRLADVPADDYRLGRAAGENLIPQPTNAAELLAGLLPELAGRLTAATITAPVPNGSGADLVCWHEREVSADAISAALGRAAAGELAGILGCETAPIVSTDVLGSTLSGTYDVGATMVIGGRVSKTLTWFDNGWGYAHRAVELLARYAALDAAGGAP